MQEQNSSRRGFRTAALIVAIVVVARSAVFVFAPQSHFDSDQAVTGLMAKHLSEGRAFPVFWYGQSYMLAVEAWIAAPLMRLLGPTVTALKLPLLAVNVAIGVLLLKGLTDDTGLPVVAAFVAVMFFALTAPITSAHLVTANGGNVEPLLYVLLLWFLRRRGWALGLVLGIGFLNREFTIYGAMALVAIAAIDRDLLTAGAVRRFATMLGVAAAVWLVVLALKQVSSAAGPGTSVSDLYTQMASNNVAEVLRRVCFDPAALASGVRGMFAIHFPQMFGTFVQPLTDFGIESRGVEGGSGASVGLAITFGIAVAGIAIGVVRARRWDPRWNFCVYLVVTAGLSVGGYIAGRCGVVDLYTMRYELLSLPGAVGLSGWFFSVAPRRFSTVFIIFATWTLATAAAADVRLGSEYLHDPPVPQKQLLIDALRERHVRYGYADFWTAYYVTFLTRERIVLAADDAVRIRTYNRLVEEHAAEAVKVSRRACSPGVPITPAFWLCDAGK